MRAQSAPSQVRQYLPPPLRSAHAAVAVPTVSSLDRSGNNFAAAGRAARTGRSFTVRLLSTLPRAITAKPALIAVVSFNSPPRRPSLANRLAPILVPALPPRPDVGATSQAADHSGVRLLQSARSQGAPARLASPTAENELTLHRSQCVRSDTSLPAAKCGSCERQGVDCTYDRPMKKRGPASPALFPGPLAPR